MSIITREPDVSKPPAPSSRGKAARRRPRLGLEEQMLKGCEAMARYALGSGKTVPAQLIENLHLLSQNRGDLPEPPDGRRSSVNLLARTHHQLSQIVAPATPRTLLLLEEDKEDASAWRFLGPIRIIRRLMGVGFLCLVIFLFTTLSPLVTGQVDFVNSSGSSLLLNELLLLSAAGIGAAFAALFKVNGFVADGTYDPRYDSSYWARFGLGVLAGMVLGVLIPMDQSNHELGRPLLALLGGFSASVVYRLLARLVETLESLVQGETRDVIAQQRAAADMKASQLVAAHRVQMAADLVKVREQLQQGGDTQVLQDQLSAILSELLSDEQAPGAD
ncbi:MAG TPA: hypothetical protein VFV09_09870 [Actinomycetota bacterium]|nr:hypothetical protein [Actinomycetota bacterium]